MSFVFFTAEQIILLHDNALNAGELQGMAGGKSLEGALSRIEFRVQYGMINDVYDLAAVYAVAISQAHVFNDANKRTAHVSMKFCLKVHGVTLPLDTTEVGDVIIKVAQGHMDEEELAKWLRNKKLEI
jgi:death-on-curing protein